MTVPPTHVCAAWDAIKAPCATTVVSGGLSSSRVWKVQVGSLSFALKAHPAATMGQERIEQLHAFQRLLSQTCEFVPKLQLTRAGGTFIHSDSHFWELSTWLNGAPVETQSATIEHGRSAITALIKLHQASQENYRDRMPIPAIESRIDLIHRYRENRALLSQFSSSDVLSHDSQRSSKQLAFRTIRCFVRDSDRLLRQLASLQSTSTVFLVLRDIHREHVLFKETRVTGVIDFGAVRLDHPVVDLVRLLGTMFPHQASIRHQLLQMYNDHANRSISLDLYLAIDHASTLLSAMQWVQWLIVEKKQFAVAMPNLLARWAMLVDRLEQT